MNNNQPLVSIIIPVYKVEQYLPECIDSVLSQTYQNLEIILVDDGSPDRCGEICDVYAEKDARIRVIHKENGGVGSARNMAISCAMGTYFYFVDSDDFIASDTIEDLVALAQVHDADMVCAASYSVDEHGTVISEENNESSVGTIVLNCVDALRYYAPKEWGPWNRLVKSDIHRGVFFPDFKICEDEAIKFKLIERCHTIINTDVVKYFYRRRAGSATANDSKTDRMDMFYSSKQNIDYLKEHHPKVVTLFLPVFCASSLYNLDYVFAQQRSHQRQIKLNQITAAVKEYALAIILSPYCSISVKLRCLFMACSNWNIDNNFYIRFYALIDRLRNR